MVQAADPSASDQLPAVSLPSIEEVFPLDKCLQVGWGPRKASQGRSGAACSFNGFGRHRTSSTCFCSRCLTGRGRPAAHVARLRSVPRPVHSGLRPRVAQRAPPHPTLPQVPGINHYESVIRAVYDYWRAKHQRAGRPLIQRLWYEPPWDRRKAARLASAAGEDGGEGEEGPFHAQDSPVALAGIRKRRMDPEEVKSRFQEIRWAGGGAGGLWCGRGWVG